MISTRGNWPLTPTMDVVVPHTRTVADLVELLDALVVDDPETRGDFWRRQPWIPIPRPSEIRPRSFAELLGADAGSGSDAGSGDGSAAGLRGTRLGVPRMFIGADSDADRPVETHPDIVALWEAARRALEARGAEVVEVDFPAVSNYERDRPGALGLVERGLWPEGYLREEVHDLQAWGFDDFLRANGDPELDRLADADGARIYPVPAGTVPDALEVYDDVYDIDMAEYVAMARGGLPERLEDFEHLEAGVRGLETARRVDLEEWMDRLGLDALVFPAAADVSREDTERNAEENRRAWTRKGVGVSNGGLVPRHYGIPTVTVPMGRMPSTAMPVGLTFAGRSHDDWRLVSLAAAYESATRMRERPERTPALAGPGAGAAIPTGLADPASPLEGISLEVAAAVTDGERGPEIEVRVRADADSVEVGVHGAIVPLERDGSDWVGGIPLDPDEHRHVHSEWRDPYGSLVTVLASREGAGQTGAFLAVGGIV